jgi:hypothetical protein
MFIYLLYFCSLIFFKITTKYFIPNLESKSHILPDILHKLFYLPDYYISDIMVFLEGLFLLYWIEYQNFKEAILILSISQFTRSILSSVTILPPLKKYNDKKRLYGILGTGRDYIFSGHSAYSALITIYIIKQKLIDTYDILIYNIICNLIIIFTRNHYTVDVLLSIIIIPSLWLNLHFCKNIDYCKDKIEWMF